MSDYTPQPDFGNMFRNKYKTADNQPAYKGDINVNGKVMEIAGWVKQDKNGDKFISVKLSEKMPTREQQPQQVAQQAQEPIDDNIPF